ncbi:hypothetical protein Klosneuvirus_10_7 [Klosneuvirus KNV1]|uniref:Uncharacterized protein n=1 Tax=Klosneuvirus KNV1 TaxID=1977640 RepID=A0A1V0SLX7_9VIRU|nr:hypothetical protein Klosneuvirus_10_7 [Klosneuvirus KNV1]
MSIEWFVKELYVFNKNILNPYIDEYDKIEVFIINNKNNTSANNKILNKYVSKLIHYYIINYGKEMKIINKINNEQTRLLLINKLSKDFMH